MKLNKGNKVFIVNTTSSLNHLKSLYVKEVSKTMDESFEITATKRMYGYKFKQDSELMSLRFKLNPYLVFFENRITDVNMALNKGLCVMYPSTLVTGCVESHVKFVGNSGALLYEWSKRDKSSAYGIDDIMAMFSVIGARIDTESAVQKVKRIIELLITDLFLIIE